MFIFDPDKQSVGLTAIYRRKMAEEYVFGEWPYHRIMSLFSTSVTDAVTRSSKNYFKFFNTA